MHEEPRAHEELLVQILHEEECRRARRASLLTAGRDCTLPSGSDRTRVHASDSGAASESGGRAAARWRQEEN
eukprot:1519543-Pleurochrysis_carterae.AAC.2